MKLEIILNKNYKDLIKKETYEIVLLDIINSSKYIFDKKYIHMEKQDNGESDFKSLVDNELIDAKTIFPKKQCESLSLNEMKVFIENIIVEFNEAFSSVMYDKGNSLNSSIFYEEIKKAFSKIEDNENVIVFIPFPFTMELEETISSRLGSDIFSQIILKMKKDEEIFFKNHKIYFIYPNIENKVIIKNLYNNKIEFLRSNILSNYIYVNF